MSYIWHVGNHTFAKYNNNIHYLGECVKLWRDYYYGVGGFDGDLYCIPWLSQIVLFLENELHGLTVISDIHVWDATDVTTKQLISRRHTNHVAWYGEVEFKLSIEASRKYRAVLLSVGYKCKTIDKSTCQYCYDKPTIPKIIITNQIVRKTSIPQVALKAPANQNKQ